MKTQTDQRQQTLAVLEEAWQAGGDAAIQMLAELHKAGPRWQVIDESDPTAHLGDPGWQMLDLCGRAYLQVDGNSATHRRLRQLLKRDGYGQAACSDLPSGGRAYYSDGYPSGFHLSLFDMHSRQELGVDEAAHRAAQAVLAKHGMETSLRTWID